MPLAIELAAARTAALDIEELAARLDDRFRVLACGYRTAMPRHQTLRATLDWSYELLPEMERTILRRLAIFAGGFTLDSAGAVAAGGDCAAEDVVYVVLNLAMKSLVAADAGGARAPYRLLETTRAYALGKLGESGERAQVARCHAEFHRDLLQRAQAEWETRPTSEWLADYGRLIDDVRAALDWAFSPAGDAAIGVTLAAAAVPLWFQLSLTDECCQRARQALANIEPESPGNTHLQMQLLAALGASINYTQGPVQETGEVWTKVHEIAESLDDVEFQLRALWGLWSSRIFGGEFARALALSDKFRSLASRRGERPDLLIADRMKGLALYYLGDQNNARVHIERMLEGYVAPVRRSHVVRFLIDQRIGAQIFLARVLWLQGFPEQALRAAHSIVENAQQIDHALSLYFALVQAACPIALFAGDLEFAERSMAMLRARAPKHHWTLWNSWGGAYEALLQIRRGDVVEGSRMLRARLDELRDIGLAMPYTEFCAGLALGLLASGECNEGLAVIEDALEWGERREEGWCIPELLRIKGELLLLQSGPDALAVAAENFEQSLDRARRQGALSWELRTAISVARVWHQHGRTSAAHELLQSVYSRFTEGLATADLSTAKRLLEQFATAKV